MFGLMKAVGLGVLAIGLVAWFVYSLMGALVKNPTCGYEKEVLP